MFRQIYRELVEINTTNSVGDSVRAADAMAARLKAAGLPADDVQVISSGPRKGNLVAMPTDTFSSVRKGLGWC